jgi:hypothetical protein
MVPFFCYILIIPPTYNNHLSVEFQFRYDPKIHSFLATNAGFLFFFYAVFHRFQSLFQSFLVSQRGLRL